MQVFEVVNNPSVVEPALVRAQTTIKKRTVDATDDEMDSHISETPSKKRRVQATSYSSPDIKVSSKLDNAAKSTPCDKG